MIEDHGTVPPLVSIVTPCLNGMPYIRDAIRSVERESSYVCLEHIVMDGLSTDNTLELLEQAPKVIYQSRRDRGLYDALNQAIKLARGQYVQWLNTDDELGKGFLSEAIELLERRTDLAFVVGDTLFVDAGGAPLCRWSYTTERIMDPRIRAQRFFFNINSMVIRSEVLRRVGEFDQDRYTLAADRDFELRLILSGAKGVAIPWVAYRFRRHDASLTASAGSSPNTLLETSRLFRHWSGANQLPVKTRRMFARAALELEIGLALKHLRSAATRREGFDRLKACLREAPLTTVMHMPRWFYQRYLSDKLPMGMDPMRVKRCSTA
ncbi:MAG: glycosyltransferase [Bradymonadales bacterium]|nr:glycosyltransferase [Bradymonadales bacterium]